MERERYHRIQDIFIAALDRAPQERDAFLDDACGGDSDLRDVVARYLRADAEEFSLLDGDAVVEPHINLSDGTTMGAYRLERLLGQGGMGVVYKALDPKLNRPVALKFLPPHLSADEISKQRFLREAQAAAALDHPHVGTIYEIAETESGRLYIAMAYYEGETVQERIARGPVPLEEAVRIASQTARGLEAAHRRGVIHRDIKPANLILTSDGMLKIVDFGIAKVAGYEHAEVGGLIGTAAYMSPEQASGGPIDHRADLWSLGVVLYEMVSGRRPFEGPYLDALRYAILHEPPAPLDEAPETVRRVVNRLLEKDFEARYPSAADVLADLERCGSQRAAAELLESSDRLPDNLPAPLTSFVGRDRELEQVHSLLEEVRLVTLTGTGGAGKTRLAVQLASAVRERFGDGVSFVSFEAVRDPDLVAPTIAQSLGLRETGVPLRERLLSLLREKDALLVIDNFEPVVEAGPLLAEMLSACPRLKILVTSRIALRIRGEHEYPVPPLELPATAGAMSLETLSKTEAVALFVQRAVGVRPSFELLTENASAVAEICRRLDGLPLAIELAAARIKVLSPIAIRSRLRHRLDLLTGGARDAPERHRTLREAIAWSYDLLTKDEKKLFRRLALFVGGCTLESVDVLCRGTDGIAIEHLDGIASLVDKNLLRLEDQPDGEPRFFMYETIREFAIECLIGSGEEASVRRAYRDYFLSLAERAVPLLTGREQSTWLGRLQREHDNLRAALEWTLSVDGDVAAAARFGAALWRFWLVHGHLDEGNEQLERILDRAGSSLSLGIRTRLLTGAGTMAHNQGHYRAARSFYEQSLDLYRTEGDAKGVAQALNNLGWTAWRLSNYDAAQSLSQESLALHRQHNDCHGEALSLNNLGWVAHYRGDFRTGQTFFEQVMALQRARNDQRGVAFAQNCLGYALSEQGDYSHGVQLLEEALTSFREVGDRQLTAFTLGRLGDVLSNQGDTDRAVDLLEQESLPVFRSIGDGFGTALVCAFLARAITNRGDLTRAEALWEESLTLRIEMEDRHGVAESLAGLGETDQRRGDLGRAEVRYKASLEQRLEIGDKRGIVECLTGLARLAHGSGDARRSTVLFSASEALLASIGGVRHAQPRSAVDEVLSTLKSTLGEAFARAWDAGQDFSFQKAAAFAFAVDDAV